MDSKTSGVILFCVFNIVPSMSSAINLYISTSNKLYTQISCENVDTASVEQSFSGKYGLFCILLYQEISNLESLIILIF